MTTTRPPAPTRIEAVRPVRVTPRSQWRNLKHRGLSTEQRTALLLTVLSVAIAVAVYLIPDQLPFMALTLPLLLGSILLGPRTLPWFVILVMLLVTVNVPRQTEPGDDDTRLVIALLVQFLMGLVVLTIGLRRSRLGVTGTAGESMLVDLRDRILTQGTIPYLPPGWDVQSALRSAGGTPFAGDFVVASTSRGATRLDVAVVDVSGKGEEAGTRALLLSGAFGGLLTALPADQFLSAANDFLLRQDWDEGFATAIHLSLDLVTGAFEVRTAGHPPAAHRAVGSGRWQVLRTEGPILGVIEDATFTTATGMFRPGDAVLLYTDGMVEEPRRDIDLGIDRMLGQAESLLRGSFDDAATRLANALGSPDDDRALLVVHRR
jgi:hypothetical protein